MAAIQDADVGRIVGGDLSTIFSAFSLETALLIERSAPVMAGVYALTSVLACVGGLFLRLLLIRHLA